MLLGNQLKELGMLIVQDAVWNRVSQNRERKIATRYYCDEFHLLLKEKQTAVYSVEIWKRFRKWGGIPTGLTQNVGDFLKSEEIEGILGNSDFVYLLNQNAKDQAILADKLGLSEKQLAHAAVSDGLLSIQVHDTDSGAKAVYVNGYEFTELTGGTLNIRLQQFDAGYEYFTIYAMDNAGNMSEIYKTKNPYYKDPADTSDKNPAEQLPESAKPTKPGSATGTVTEHTKTDSNGNTTSQSSSPAEQKKQAMKEADAAEKAESGKTESTEKSGQGKEFYTIQTATDKVFYLVIDRDGEEEKVYFLTEITENDLLNATSDNSETLPKNSAALESAIPNGEGASVSGKDTAGAVSGYYPERRWQG